MTDTVKRLANQPLSPPRIVFRTCASLMPRNGVNPRHDPSALANAGFLLKNQVGSRWTWRFEAGRAASEPGLLILLHHEPDPNDFVEYPKGSGHFPDVNWFGEVVGEALSDDPRDRERHLQIVQDAFAGLFDIAGVCHSNMANPRYWDWLVGSRNR